MKAATAETGHNSGISADKLKAFITKIERTEAEKQGVADEIKAIYAELSGEGFEAKIVKKIVALRKKNDQQRREEQDLLETYCSALQFELF